ncbi:MAG TPA: amidohydrolase family protein [Chthoniobacteraceae bacterium]|jgi:predicted TIM-barrel fold metal-dependent hydrolase|nr:amidohydrolase family protein [Chthoniobacteraceae bacterium]
MTPHRISRRTFLQSTAGAAGACVLGELHAAETKRVPVVDTHLHCFAGTADPRFPYPAGAPYRPEKPATPEQLLACMAGAGVDFAVVVHPEPYQDDHRYLEHCLEVGGAKVKGTCLFFADRPDATTRMTELVRRLPGRIAAARVHAYAPDRLPPFGKPELRALWKQAADLGLMMQLHFEPRYAPGFEPLIQEFAGTKVLIDHLGRPLQGTPEEHEAVIRWSRFPNTVMKISALPESTKYPHRDVQPIVRRLTDAFGADRLMAGYNFDQDATPATYRAGRAKVEAVLAHLSADDQAKVLGGTAARLFKF